MSCDCGTSNCGCCDGIAVTTPRPVDNRPGLAAIAARIGSHGDFRQSLHARLSQHRFADGSRPLQALTTRDPADPAIALLDGFACLGDLLTFTSERIANESYLGTATEFRSVQALAALIGYVPRPGVAASGWLAFEIDPATTTAVTIARGMRVQSVPGQDELPQSFETSDALVARAAWNRIGLRLAAPQVAPDTDLWLAGTATGLKPGDALLFDSGGGAPAPMRVLTVTPDTAADRTLVRFEPWRAAGIADPKLADILANTPAGVTAAGIAAAVAQFQAAPPDKARAMAPALIARIKAAQAGLSTATGTPLRVWLDAIGAQVEALAAAPAAAATSDPGTSDDQPDRARLRIDRLAVAPSQPPATAARLVRSSAASFRLGAAATLQLLRRTAPAVGDAYPAALAGDRAAAPPQPLRVYALRLRTGLFGRAFPKRVASLQRTVSDNVRAFETVEVGEWPIRSVAGKTDLFRESETEITLDSTQDGITPGSWMLIDMHGTGDTGQPWIVRPTAPLLVTRIDAVEAKRARADYGGSGDATALTLADGNRWIEYRQPDGDNGPDLDDQAAIDRDFQLIRRTTVHARPELLALADAPITDDFCLADSDAPIELAGLHPDLEPGRFVVVSGERADIADTAGVMASEVAMIARIVHDVRADPRATDGAIRPLGDLGDDGDPGLAMPGDTIHSFIWFDRPLSYCYRRATVALYGNVARATHGETRVEVLGNGDAAKAHQRFALKQAPLTFVAAATARGAAAALDVRVDDILWRQVDQLFDSGPADRHYLLRPGADGQAIVQFGDGREGARPPSGSQNVRATYRTGIGRPGNVRARQLEQLATRPLGVRGVTNPLPATGGADPESRDQARRNAPVTTMALDRLVSVQDHADFARGFAGIAKAAAVRISDGARRLVHLTIAAEADAPLDPGDDLVVALRRALAALGDPGQTVRVAPRELRLLIIAARLAIDADRSWDSVVAAARARLFDRFGFENRSLATGVSASEIIAVLQSVPGVAHVDLDVFGSVATVDGPSRLPLTPPAFTNAVAAVIDAGVIPRLAALPARRGESGILPAELLLLSPEVPATLILNELR
ncbi:putative baseplate assembly protein [Polymorphobacter fuscus]|uniref:Putative baseplate assembly protein n=1 Tax=Sandarakinorhabdus fusca TaxID=1439888 RepID=A0A7C9KYR3_9SPHN|nr:putative baseplate assembly protein [Polymorphobacter fuscus]KAB7647942.1 putative baseplate assembly protein [Polymorphobacter fuscus]MQT17268.1 putative baseplate assembly protein [Polymorphobacter fuscus]NJC08737.1 hypothetical protein [Polymorphobacter fuscus]